MNTTVTQQPTMYIPSQTHQSLFQGNISNFMSCPTTLTSQQFQNNQQLILQGCTQSGQGILPQSFFQQQQPQQQQQSSIIQQGNQINNNSLMLIPTMMGTNGFQQMPLCASSNQQGLFFNGMMWQNYPFNTQQFFGQNYSMIPSNNQQLNNNLSLNLLNLINTQNQINAQSQIELQKIFTNNTDQLKYFEKQQTDQQNIPSLANITNLGISSNINTSTSIQNFKEITSSETSLLNSQKVNQIITQNNNHNNSANELYLNSSKKQLNENQIFQSSPQQLSENNSIHLTISQNDDSTSFKLIKNNSITNPNQHGVKSSSGSTLMEGDQEEAFNNNQFQSKSNIFNGTMKIDQCESVTSHEHACNSENISNASQTKSKNKSSRKPSNKQGYDISQSICQSRRSKKTKTQQVESNKQITQLLENNLLEKENDKQVDESQNILQKQQEKVTKKEDSKIINEEMNEDENEQVDEEQSELEQNVDKKTVIFEKQNSSIKNSKQDQITQQKQQNKAIKEQLLEKASSAEKELLNQIQQISKQNSAKAFLKAYKKFALQDQGYIYNYEINENQYYYKVCRDMPIIRIENPSKKDLEGFYRKFKKFFNGKQYNNNTLKIVVKNKLYGKLFNDFLELHSDSWLDGSKSKNKDDLRIIIKFLEMCHLNLDYLVFLRDHDKSKEKSHGYDSE